MKYALILLLLFLLFIDLNSQDTIIVPNYVYSEIVGTQKFLSTKVNVEIYYGQESSFFTDKRIRDEVTGEVKSFNSMIDALNFMALKGWEFVHAYVVIRNDINYYHWLLKRPLSDKEKIDFIPKIKRDFQKE